MSKRIPLLEEVLKYQKEKNLILSMPGNKSGIGFLRDDIGKEFVNNMGFLDITEVDPLDNLHCPEGIIKEAQDLLAKTYGSKKAYFVVNGSTAGNLASIFDAFNEGYEVLVERNCHKSIYNGLILRKLKVRYIEPVIHEDKGLFLPPTEKEIYKALEGCNNPKGIILTYPNYFGIGYKVFDILRKLKEKGFTYEQDGALWFKSTEFGDDKDRVLIKSDGSYTYLTPDIAYHLNKLDRGYEYLVDLLGADHHGYINRMKAAIQALGYNSDQLNIDILQMVRMMENGEVVKMSKRTGNAITIKDLIDDIGVDATRYFFAAKAANTPYDFDLTLAKSKSNDNPVYYAQYAHARMCSILRQAKENDITIADHFELLVNDKEMALLKHINEFRNEIADSAKSRSPHKIANYIQRLAQLFHSFYNDCYVIDKENIELSMQRLALVEATRITLKNALNLIGVEAPEKM
mgnify:CR=1 FL=1